MKKIISLVLSVTVAFTLLFAMPVMANSNSNTIVYVTNTGECYHNAGCRYLKRSCNQTTLGAAVSSGYRACSICNPPQLVVTPDVPATPSVPTNPTPAQPVQNSISDAQAQLILNQNVQTCLNAFGYDCGKPDGIIGQKTVNALIAFQQAYGIPQTGAIDQTTMNKLVSLLLR